MTVCVTGGTGVVGTALVRRLVAEGRQVRGLARSDAAAAALQRVGAEPVAGDVLDHRSLKAAFGGCELVYHAAGIVEFCSRIPTRMFDVNVAGTSNVIEAAQTVGVGRVVHTSSTVTLGESRGEIGSESTVHRGRFLTRYERSKVEAENLALGAARSGSLDVVAVNPASVQGPGRAHGTGRIFLDAVNGDLRAMVDTTFSIVDVDDCALGHILAASVGVRGERYVLSGTTLTSRQALALLGDLTGRPPRVRIIPSWMLAPLGPVAELVGRRVTRLPLCGESVRQARSGARYDGSRAQDELGLTYRTARQTFTRMLEWFRAEGLTER